MSRIRRRDRQRVIDLTHDILRCEGWRVCAAPSRIVRPCVWVEASAHDVEELWVVVRTPLASGKGWSCALISARKPEDGTGCGWHRRAAERIAAMVRGWR